MHFGWMYKAHGACRNAGLGSVDEKFRSPNFHTKIKVCRVRSPLYRTLSDYYFRKILSSTDVSATPIERHQKLRIFDDYSRIFPLNAEEDLVFEASLRAL